MARFRHALVLPVLGSALLAALIAACSGSHHGDTAAFCAQLKVDAPTLTGRPTDAITKRTTTQAFHRLAKLAPAAIFDDWARLTVLVDKLAAFDPVHDDPFGDIYAAALDRLEVLAGELPRRALRLVAEWAELHRDELAAMWARAAARQPLGRIDPLP